MAARNPEMLRTGMEVAAAELPASDSGSAGAKDGFDQVRAALIGPVGRICLAMSAVWGGGRGARIGRHPVRSERGRGRGARWGDCIPIPYSPESVLKPESCCVKTRKDSRLQPFIAKSLKLALASDSASTRTGPLSDDRGVLFVA